MKLHNFLTFVGCLIYVSSAFDNQYLYENQNKFISNDIFDDEVNPPISELEEFDWRHKGAVSPVKDQKTCGSCYAFAAVESIESQYFMISRKLVSLSEQQVVDCSKSYGNDGCHKGTIEKTFRYIRVQGGLMNEEHYPYKGVENKRCMYVKNSAIVKIGGYHKIRPSEAVLLKELESTGPVALMINLKHSLRTYDGGIYDETDCKSSELHGVLLVGYGSEKGQDYWILKNSWVNFDFIE